MEVRDYIEKLKSDLKKHKIQMEIIPFVTDKINIEDSKYYKLIKYINYIIKRCKLGKDSKIIIYVYNDHFSILYYNFLRYKMI